MHRTARARYGPLASSLNRILVRYIFHELQQKYEENRCRLERATEFHEILVKQSLHKVFSAWYVRFLEQENTVQFLSSIVHTLADRAYDVCHTRVLRPGKWFLDTPSYRLLRKAWDASWWKYKSVLLIEQFSCKQTRIITIKLLCAHSLHGELRQKYLFFWQSGTPGYLVAPSQLGAWLQKEVERLPLWSPKPE